MENEIRKKEILIADDDPAIVESLTLILQEFGYQVKSTGDGRTLHRMQKRKKNFPDLVLLDIWMSGHDGREICLDLKKQESTKHIPIILISAGRDIKKSANDACADDYLEKPFAMDDLIQKVEKWTNKSSGKTKRTL